MKPITQKRILAALNKLCKQTYNKKIMQQMQVLALHGLKSFTGSLELIDRDKLNLELQLIGDPLPTSSKDFSVNFKRVMNIQQTRQSKILSIQTKNNISGLKWETIDINPNTKSLTYPFFNDLLRPIDRDMETLLEYKVPVIQYWIDYAVSAGLTAYRELEDDWQQTTANSIWAASFQFDWANIWLDKYYLSPSTMKREGIDTQRKKPEKPDDELYIEWHLTIGSGTDWDSIDGNTLSFCASNYFPSC